MNPMRYLNPCLFAALLVMLTPGCHKPASEKTTFEGRWSGIEPGQPEAKCSLVITGTQLEYRGSQSNDWCRGTFVLNEKARPRQMDLTMRETPAPQDVGMTILVIYELQGEELKVAIAPPGSPQRPTRLASGEGNRFFSFMRD